MKPSPRTIKRRLKELRALIDNGQDPCTHRIAYAMEIAIRWVTEDTVGWDPPAKDALLLAKLLRDELRPTPPARKP